MISIRNPISNMVMHNVLLLGCTRSTWLAFQMENEWSSSESYISQSVIAKREIIAHLNELGECQGWHIGVILPITDIPLSHPIYRFCQYTLYVSRHGSLTADALDGALQKMAPKDERWISCQKHFPKCTYPRVINHPKTQNDPGTPEIAFSRGMTHIGWYFISANTNMPTLESAHTWKQPLRDNDLAR